MRQPDDIPTILVVNDDYVQLYAMSRALRAGGYRVLEAGSGTDALRIATAERPRLVVLDIHMPDLDGFAVCERLRQIPGLADVPVIFHTALLASEFARKQAEACGGQRLLSFPTEAPKLLAAVRELLAA